MKKNHFIRGRHPKHDDYYFDGTFKRYKDVFRDFSPFKDKYVTLTFVRRGRIMIEAEIIESPSAATGL